ncbi:hypothetical protein UFOVP315_2 [uncultured Caudovirales phage]|uniref:Uncharacterized protein n=1 Tax=uncultured Caudovirales phage TaxID=2100421 RepID=A0A6J5LVF0_9CAUD|nr:hypothetical protein UFOVP315_2 [uncultured Caudovirales phage]
MNTINPTTQRWLAVFWLAGLLAMLAGMVFADPVDSKRVELAEKVRLVLPYNVSSTINGARTTAVQTPISGWLTGLYYTYEGPNAITSGSAVIFPIISGVSVTTLSLTVPSGTVAFAPVSRTTTVARVSTTADISAGTVITISGTGSPVISGANGGLGNIVLEITPNYTPARFRQ